MDTTRDLQMPSGFEVESAAFHPDARAETATAFLERALAFYSSHGIEARRLLTDNAWAYTQS